MKQLFKNFFKNEEGQGLIEYALLIVLLAIVVIAALTMIGRSMKDKFEEVNDNLN